MVADSKPRAYYLPEAVLRRPPKSTSRWLSQEAVAAKRDRRRLERRWLATGDDDDRIAYRRACRSANKIINESRSRYYNNRLNDCVDDPGRCWRVVRELLHSSDQDRTRTDIENRSCAILFLISLYLRFLLLNCLLLIL